MKLSRALLALITAVLGTFALLGTAHAAPTAPTTQVFDLPGTRTAGDNGFCPFPVHVVYTSAQKVHNNGLNTGPATITVTNLENQKTLTYNVPGPGTLTQTSATFSGDAAGPNLLFATLGNSYPGVPQLSYSTGRIRFTAQGTPENPGPTTAYQLNGTRTDVCAALAG